ncbi:MAG: CoA pyrophosphatase [Wenzhouxiangellaceae bacterium]
MHSLETPLADLPVGGYLPEGLSRARPAAVLVGLLNQPEPSVILTVRSEQLAQHAGQVAFPGGRRELGDRSAIETALREAHEEAGIEAQDVRPLGYLGRYDTISGYRITPVVASVAARTRLLADGAEAEQVFTVAVSELLRPESWQRSRLCHQGREFEILTLHHPEHRIWGATAALLFELGQRLG